MTYIEKSAQSVFKGFTFMVKTPDGTIFVTVMEDTDKRPCGVHIHLGKSGGSANAWAQTLARTMNLALDNGAAINDLIEQLSQHTTDRSQRNDNGVEIRSGVEGVAYALMQYRREKYREHLSIVKGTDEDDRIGRLAG